MPAEFEPQRRVWVATPENPETWPGCLDEAQQQHADWCDAMRKVVEVKTVQSVGAAPEDAWIRDYGPVFLLDGQGQLALNNFTFNCWGEKYPPWDGMNAVPDAVGDYLDRERAAPVPRFAHDFVLEGGSVSVNGQGTALTSTPCLMNPNRSPGRSRGRVEQVLAETLGVTRVIWLPVGLAGDDTDGHQDTLAAWIGADTILCVRPDPDTGHPLEANWRALSQARDQDGRALNLAPLPVVDPPLYDPLDAPNPSAGGGTADGIGGFAGGDPLPASYANFFISNGHVFLPVFGRPSDDVAIRAVERAAPHLTVVPIRAEWLVVGLGSLHCLSQQQPAAG